MSDATLAMNVVAGRSWHKDINGLSGYMFCWARSDLVYALVYLNG